MGQHERYLRGPLRDWWNSTVRAANPRYAGASTQGYYVLAGDGRGLLWDNFIPRIPAFLERGLAVYRASDPGKQAISSEAVRAAADPEPPSGASVLRLYTRIRPLPAGADPMNGLLGRDYMWVLKDEVHELVARSASGTQPFALPRTLAARLVLFHMVDNVRGQVWPWQPQSVRSVDLTARSVKTTGSVRTLALSGRFAKRDAHPPQWNDRGHEGTLEGELEVDTATDRITRLRALAECRAWTDSQSPVAPPPSGRYRILTALVEANDPLARKVPPEPSGTGDYYLRPWLPALG